MLYLVPSCCPIYERAKKKVFETPNIYTQLAPNPMRFIFKRASKNQWNRSDTAMVVFSAVVAGWRVSGAHQFKPVVRTAGAWAAMMDQCRAGIHRGSIDRVSRVLLLF